MESMFISESVPHLTNWVCNTKLGSTQILR